MACVFLFYSSSCHKKKHEESHIGNGSRTSCYLASRPCRERWTLLVVVSPSTPCRERYPQMKEREHGVQHSNELPARATNTRHSTHKTAGCGTRTHYDVCSRINIRERKDERRRNISISRFISTSSRRGILLIVRDEY